MDAIAPDGLTERLAAIKKSFGRKRRPEKKTISGAGRGGVSEVIFVLREKVGEIEKNE